MLSSDLEAFGLKHETHYSVRDERFWIKYWDPWIAILGNRLVQTTAAREFISWTQTAGRWDMRGSRRLNLDN